MKKKFLSYVKSGSKQCRALFLRAFWDPIFFLVYALRSPLLMAQNGTSARHRPSQKQDRYKGKDTKKEEEKEQGSKVKGLEIIRILPTTALSFKEDRKVVRFGLPHQINILLL